LLIIDEAQNLGLKEVEELRMLSNFQLGHHPLLQSFLVGQPELRQMLRSSSMEQLRQRVTASCHLGPLGAGETRAYVEHRLHHVGWNGNPAIDPQAFATIHSSTGGIPRRINVLCTRVFLACWLQRRTEITAADVSEAAAELMSELGGVNSLEIVSSGTRPGHSSVA
jgi:general secretion pathway protein A